LLTQSGIANARAMNLFACEQAFLDGPWPQTPRDVDVLFIGNFHFGVQRERLRWLGRLGDLADRWRVALHTGVYGEAYRQLLGRSRLLTTPARRGESTRRVFEAAAAGALLFQERGNAETETYLRAGKECVVYTDQDLEPLLHHYLEHEDQRQALAEAACRR